MFDISRLKGRIVEKFGTQKAFAQAIGKDEAYVSRYLHSQIYLDQTEIDTWANVLDIDSSDISTYFFAKKIDETQI